MKLQIKHLKGDDLPRVWRPTWVECWVVELDGALVGGPYGSETEAQAVANGEQEPELFQAPAP